MERKREREMERERERWRERERERERDGEREMAASNNYCNYEVWTNIFGMMDTQRI